MKPEAVPERDTARLDRLVSRILLGGVLTCTAILLIGVALLPFQPAAHPPIPPYEILPSAVRLNPQAIIQMGILILMATPIIRVISSMIMFMHERDFPYSIITLYVLLIVIAGLLLGST